MSTPTYDNPPEATWPPVELDAYSSDSLENRGELATVDLTRFAALAHCLAGLGEPSPGREASDTWAVDPSYQALKPMVLGLQNGGDIVDVGAGVGEPAPGMLLELERLGLTGTRYLATDVGEGYTNSPGGLDGLAYELTRLSPGQRIWVDPNHQVDYHSPWSDVYIDQDGWRGLRERVLRRYGPEWDATEPNFFDHVREALNGREIGLLLLRHPQISEEPEVFADIISNLMSEAVRSDIPLLITTSTNPTSRERIQAAIDAFWADHPDIQTRWQTMPWNTPKVVQLATGVNGSRKADSLAWAIFPQPKI